MFDIPLRFMRRGRAHQSHDACSRLVHETWTTRDTRVLVYVLERVVSFRRLLPSGFLVYIMGPPWSIPTDSIPHVISLCAEDVRQS